LQHPALGQCLHPVALCGEVAVQRMGVDVCPWHHPRERRRIAGRTVEQDDRTGEVRAQTDKQRRNPVRFARPRDHAERHVMRTGNGRFAVDQRQRPCRVAPGMGGEREAAFGRAVPQAFGDRFA